MSLLDTIARIRAHLEHNGRVSYRVVKREFELDDDGLEDVIEGLVDIQGVAERSERALSWLGAQAATEAESIPSRPSPEPRSYTPKHLAEKILQSRAALEGERKQVTVSFCDIKGSMTLARVLDAEDWHRTTEIKAGRPHRCASP